MVKMAAARKRSKFEGGKWESSKGVIQGAAEWLAMELEQYKCSICGNVFDAEKVLNEHKKNSCGQKGKHQITNGLKIVMLQTCPDDRVTIKIIHWRSFGWTCRWECELSLINDLSFILYWYTY